MEIQAERNAINRSTSGNVINRNTSTLTDKRDSLLAKKRAFTDYFIERFLFYQPNIQTSLWVS